MEKLLHHHVERFAAERPESIAISYGDEQFSYAELNALANQWAHLLRGKGIAVGDFVGLYLSRSLNLIVALLAILKVGAAYVPLDPNSPETRVQTILKDVAPHYTISDENAGALAGFTKMITIAELKKESARYSSENISVVIDPVNFCYVIYTSGTTGKPNGVCISHHNVMYLLKAAEEVFDFSPADVWALFHLYTFDFSVWEIWGAFAFGGKVVLVAPDTCRLPADLYQFILKEKITILNLTPAIFYKLSEVVIENKNESTILPLKTIIFGGDALDNIRLKPWFEYFGEDEPALYNMYGITETTVHVTYHKIQPADLDGKNPVIGKPLPYYTVLLLDQYGNQITTPGMTGEICIAGEPVSQGYFGNPALTEKKFVSFNVQDNAIRLYKSGDLGFYREDGILVYVGRIDHQIKLRGYRIELGEIEFSLKWQPEVAFATVLVKGDRAENKQIVAYVQPKTQHPITPQKLRSRLKTLLPEYMVPAQIYFIKNIPLTVNNKINRSALLNGEFEKCI